uniref:Uncharacterized protein n=1 Tax=Rhizophora mucronata TaxID=61149 RepID=A0A2P2PUD7_RHIMU
MHDNHSKARRQRNPKDLGKEHIFHATSTSSMPIKHYSEHFL